MDKEINTPEFLADEVELTSADGKGNDSKVVSIKDLLSEELGRDFPDDATALKAVKDTFSYVGKAGKYKAYNDVIEKLQTKYGDTEKVKQIMENLIDGEVKPQVDSKDYISRDQYETDTFFAKNSNLESHRELIEALRVKTGKSLNEVVELPSFKSVYEKARAYDESEKSKSVLTTNPRLGQVTDKMTQARESASKGDYKGASASALSAVLDAYES